MATFEFHINWDSVDQSAHSKAEVDKLITTCKKEIQPLTKPLASQKRTITRALNKIQSYSASGELSPSLLAICVGDIKEALSIIKSKAALVIEKIDSTGLYDIDPDLLESHETGHYDYEMEVKQAIVGWEKSTKVIKNDHTEKTISGSDNLQKIKLPTIQLEKFDGNFSKWPAWWACFDSNVNCRKNLPDVDKLIYLRSVLEGTAFDRVKNFPITAESYNEVIELLKSSYNIKEKIISDIAIGIVDIDMPKNNASDLDKFRTSIESNLLTLKTQNVDVTAIGAFIAPIIMRKLPTKLIEQIQVRCGQDYPDTQTILDTLNKIIFTLSSHEKPQVKTETSDKSEKSGKTGFFTKNKTKDMKKSDVTNLTVSTKQINQ